MPHPPWFPLLTALLLAGCAVPPGQPGCQPRRVEVFNRATLPVEQLYFGAPGGQGDDLLRGVGMPPGTARPVVLPGMGGSVLRAVWTDGHAIELKGLDPCRNKRIVMTDGSIRAD